MATNFVHPGDVLDLTAPAGGVVAGGGYILGNMFFMALGTAAESMPFRGKATGVWELPKTAAEEWTEGVSVYWNESTGEATSAGGSGTFLIGSAAAPAANPSDTGKVRLNGISTTAEA